jgi:hypothetical protein
MQRFGINIYKKRTVHEAGHLKELYQDAWSTKHKRTICHLTMCICKVYILEKQHSKEIQVHEAIERFVEFCRASVYFYLPHNTTI